MNIDNSTEEQKDDVENGHRRTSHHPIYDWSRHVQVG